MSQKVIGLIGGIDVDCPLGDELIASLREGMAILDGTVAPSRFYPAPVRVDVRAIRKGLGWTRRIVGYGSAKPTRLRAFDWDLRTPLEHARSGLSLQPPLHTVEGAVTVHFNWTGIATTAATTSDARWSRVAAWSRPDLLSNRHLWLYLCAD